MDKNINFILAQLLSTSKASEVRGPVSYRPKFCRITLGDLPIDEEQIKRILKKEYYTDALEITKGPQGYEVLTTLDSMVTTTTRAGQIHEKTSSADIHLPARLAQALQPYNYENEDEATASKAFENSKRSPDELCQITLGHLAIEESELSDILRKQYHIKNPQISKTAEGYQIEASLKDMEIAAFSAEEINASDHSVSLMLTGRLAQAYPQMAKIYLPIPEMAGIAPAEMATQLNQYFGFAPPAESVHNVAGVEHTIAVSNSQLKILTGKWHEAPQYERETEKFLQNTQEYLEGLPPSRSFFGQIASALGGEKPESVDTPTSKPVTSVDGEKHHHNVIKVDFTPGRPRNGS